MKAPNALMPRRLIYGTALSYWTCSLTERPIDHTTVERRVAYLQIPPFFFLPSDPEGITKT